MGNYFSKNNQIDQEKTKLSNWNKIVAQNCNKTLKKSNLILGDFENVFKYSLEKRKIIFEYGKLVSDYKAEVFVTTDKKRFFVQDTFRSILYEFGNRTNKFIVKNIAWNENMIRAIVSPDGLYLFICYTYNIHVWSIKYKTLVTKVGNTPEPTKLLGSTENFKQKINVQKCTNNSKFLIIGYQQGCIEIITIPSFKIILSRFISLNPLCEIAVAKNNECVSFHAYSPIVHFMKITANASSQEDFEFDGFNFGEKDRPYKAIFSNNDKNLVTGCEKSLVIFSVEEKTVLKRFSVIDYFTLTPLYVESLHLVNNDSSILIVDSSGTFTIMDTETQEISEKHVNVISLPGICVDVI